MVRDFSSDELDADIDDALVDSLADFDERLRHGEPLDATVIAGEEPANPELIGARACLALLQRAWPRTAVINGHSPPTSIGRFELVRVLGQGGFGAVYLARDPRLGRLVALKVPRLHALANPQLRNRFLREARAAALLEHPNIVPILESGDAGPVCYIAAAYCEGPNLAQWSKDHGPAAPRLAARIVEALADATHYSHLRGVLHRDIKPSNVLLPPRNSDSAERQDTELPFVPKLTDFGLAKLAEEGLGDTPASTVLGTPCYMSPEQAMGRASEMCAASDVYSLGVILYELLSGRPPFSAEDFGTLLDQIRNDDPPRISRSSQRAPGDLETICSKCLRKPPDGRYATAADLRDDLRAYLDGRPIRARRATAIESAIKWIRRRPTAAALMVVSALAVVAVIGLQWRHAQRLEDTLAVTEGLRAEGLRREQALRQQSEVNETAAAAADIEHGQWEFAEHRRLALLETNQPGTPQGIGIEPEWNYVWGQLQHPAPRRVFRGDGSPMLSVAASPSGALIAAGNAKGSITIWETETGREVKTVRAHEGEVRALAFSPDGNSLASGGQFHHVILWNCRDWKEWQRMKGHDGTVTCLDYTSSGDSLASGGRDGRICLWDAASGELRDTLQAGDVVNGIRFGKLNRELFVADKSRQVTKWDLGAKPHVRTDLQKLENNPRGFDIAGNGQWGVAQTTKQATFFSTASNKKFALMNHVHSETAVADPSGRWAVTAQSETLDLWRLRQNAPAGFRIEQISQQRWRGHDSSIMDLAAMPDGSQVLSASEDGSVKLWGLADFNRPMRLFLNDHQATVFGIAFSADSRLLASAGHDGTIHVYSTDGFRISRRYKSAGMRYSQILFKPDGPRTLIARDERFPRLLFWRLGAKPKMRHIPALLDVDLSPDGRQLVIAQGPAGGAPAQLSLWDANAEVFHRVLLSDTLVDRVRFAPDGIRLAVAAKNRVEMLDIVSGERRVVVPRNANLLVFNSTGSKLAACSQYNLVHVFDVGAAPIQNLSEGIPIRFPRDGLCFSPDGRVMAVGALVEGMGATMLWHFQTGRNLLALETFGFHPCGVAYSPDGRFLAAGTHADANGNAGVIVWRFDPPRAPNRSQFKK